MVKLERCVGSCNALNDLSNKVCVPNKTEDLNLSMFNMITGINESKTLTKHIPCECKCKFDGRKCNSDQWWKVTCKTQNFYTLPPFLLTTIALLIAISIYCYLI